MKRPLLVLINGAAPGLGKSSLAIGLARRWKDEGVVVEFLEEPEILERQEFAALVAEWHRTGSVASTTLLDAARSYLDSCRESEATVFVIDSLLPFLPSLLAWGLSDEEVIEFLVSLSHLMQGFEVLQVQLEGDAGAALIRAAEREGNDWLDRFVKKVGAYQDEGGLTADQAGIVAYLESATARTRALLAAAPWPVRFVSVDRGPDLTMAEVWRLLEG